MKFNDQRELLHTMFIRKMTGKSAKICLLCLRRAKGDVHRAVKLCSNGKDSTEGERQKELVHATSALAGNYF